MVSSVILGYLVVPRCTSDGVTGRRLDISTRSDPWFTGFVILTKSSRRIDALSSIAGRKVSDDEP